MRFHFPLFLAIDWLALVLGSWLLILGSWFLVIATVLPKDPKQALVMVPASMYTHQDVLVCFTPKE
jgi:hypothetical protein